MIHTLKVKTIAVFTALAILILTGAVHAERITRMSGVEALDPLKKYYAVPNFKIGGTYEFGNEAAYEFGGQGGVTLESLGREPLRTAYIAAGTPKRDAAGKIVNAVIISPYYTGDATYMYFFWHEGQKGVVHANGALIGPGKMIDTDKWYVIFLDSLGMWGASKPSDGLGMKFPRYSLYDQVQANYRLLVDELKVGKVKLATGLSMGAIQSYIWAALHPDFVEAIMPLGGCAATEPVCHWLFQLMTAAMKSDPAWRDTGGDYYSLPRDRRPAKGMMFGWSVLGQSAFDFKYRNSQSWDEVRKEVFYWEPQGDEGVKLRPEAVDLDVNDVLFRNEALCSFDFTDRLAFIKARTLIVHIKNDQWLSYANAEKAARRIPGATLVAFEDPLSHFALLKSPNVLKDDVERFLREIGVQ